MTSDRSRPLRNFEVKLNGERCNLSCTYCYENPMRDAGNFGGAYDFEAIRKTQAEYGDFDITLFGGEPLIAPLERLDALLALGYESAGRTNIQTNGVLVNDEHIALFHPYNTSVGISSDGPDDMNDIRSAGTLEPTRATTARTEVAIARLCAEGISTSIIVTLHRLNTGKALPRLKEWVTMLFLLGVESMRLHILQVNSPVVRRQYVLSDGGPSDLHSPHGF